MKTSALVGIVLAAHCVVIGFLMMVQGCGTVRPVPEKRATPAPTSTVARAVSEPVLPPLPSVAPAAPTTPRTTTYTVSKGDSLSSVASRFKVSVAELKALNRLSNVNALHLGQKLVLPGDINIAAPPPKVAVAAVSEQLLR